LLDEHGAAYTYREYTKDPLTADEIRSVLGKLGLTAHDVARTRDANKLGIDLSATDEASLIAAMAENPGLLQRPIAVVGDRAVLGRPVDGIVALL